MNKKGQSEGVVFIVIIILLVLAVLGAMWALPKYMVYSQELSGKADLKEAEWSRQIAVEEAKATKDSATLKSEAEVIRARGIAEANRIISQSLTKEYIQYKFVEGLNDGNTEVIYVPTEANLPLLEARNK